jgi:hypothetical protein
MQCLTTNEIGSAEDPEVQEAMRELHPEALPGDAPGELPRPPGAEELERTRLSVKDEGLLKEMLACASNRAAAGPSGLSGAHLEPLLRDEECREGIYRILETAINGDLGDRSKELLLASRLLAARKPAGGYRPIAVGEALLRLAERAVLMRLLPVMAHHFGTLQLGCGARGGAEIGSHLIQAILYSDAGQGDDRSAGVAFDARHAFGLVSRSNTLEELYAVPAFAPVYRMAYWLLSASPVLLMMSRGRVCAQLHSSRGVRQGDALGTFLYCVSVHRLYQQAIAAAPEGTVVGTAHVDNFVLLGAAQHVVTAARAFINAVATRGDLELSKRQEKVMWLRADDDPPPAVLREFAEERGSTLIAGDEQVVKLLGVHLCADRYRAGDAAEVDLQEYIKDMEILLHKDLPTQRGFSLRGSFS